MPLSGTWDILGNGAIGREISKCEQKIPDLRALLDYFGPKKRSQCNWSGVMDGWRGTQGQMVVVIGNGTFDLGPSELL